jgi:hypothetical protein
MTEGDNNRIREEMTAERSKKTKERGQMRRTTKDRGAEENTEQSTGGGPRRRRAAEDRGERSPPRCPPLLCISPPPCPTLSHSLSSFPLLSCFVSSSLLLAEGTEGDAEEDRRAEEKEKRVGEAEAQEDIEDRGAGTEGQRTKQQEDGGQSRRK